jgi:hypothetical protein
MENLTAITLGIVAGLGISFGVLLGIDLEVAKDDYNKNVEQCKPIYGCLFSMNCERYNKMIEQKCKKGE